MEDINQHPIKARWVPAPVSQLGDYELDLLKIGFFGWVNAASIVTEYWLGHLATQAEAQGESA